MNSQDRNAPKSTMRRLSSAALAVLAWPFATTPSIAAVPLSASLEPAPWQKISREANVKFGDDDFPAAIAGYKAAIAELKKHAPSSEALLDVYLNLADSYRRNDETPQAAHVLDEVAPRILSRHCEDPLLPARYWRRRADVCLNQMDGAGYARAFSNALRVASENLPEEYRKIVKDKLLFLRTLSRMKLYAFAAPVALELKNTRPASLDEKKHIEAGLQDFTLSIEMELNYQLSKPVPNDPRPLLELLSQLSPDTQITPNILELREKYARESFLKGAARVAKEQMGPPTEEYFRTACQMQPHWPPGSKPEKIAAELDSIALYKMNLARVLNNLGKVDEAVAVMDSIPEAALIRQDEKYWHRYGRINSLIAKSQARRGTQQAANKRFDSVANIVEKISDPQRANDLKQHLQKCRQGTQ